MASFVLAVVLAVISGVSFAIGIYILYRDWPYFSMRKAGGSNNDSIATDSFTGLMKSAKHKISISDHGNIMGDSVYENDEVIRITERKLKENPNFIIQCRHSGPDIARRSFAKISSLSLLLK